MSTSTMSNNCFLCKNDMDGSFSSDSHSQENCLVLCQILNVPHLENIAKKFQNINYCHPCTTRILKMKDLLEKLEKLKKEFLDEKCVIRSQLEGHYLNIGDEFRNQSDRFGVELVNEWKNPIRYKGKQVGRKTHSRTGKESSRIMKDVAIFKNFEQEVVDEHNICKFPAENRFIAPLISNFISVNAQSKQKDLSDSFLEVKPEPDIGDFVDLSDGFNDSRINDSATLLTPDMLDFQNIKFESLIPQPNSPIDIRDPFEGIVPESNIEVQRKDVNEIIHFIASEHKRKIIMPETNNEGHTLKQKHIEEAFKCVYCEKTFQTSIETKTHERTHSDENPYKCKYCEMTFPDLKNFIQHLPVHKMEIPDDVHKGELLYECIICKKSYATAEYLKRHELRHSGVKPFKCNYCEKTFHSTVETRIHERTHTGEKPYKCKFCVKVFAQRCVRRTHERIHTGEKPFKCQYCEKTFSHNSVCKRHEQRLHTTDRPYQCRYCVKKFNIRYDLENHERVHTGEKPFKCKYCEKVFAQCGNLKNHERVHTRPIFNRRYCNESFTQKDQCQDHELTHISESVSE